MINLTGSEEAVAIDLTAKEGNDPSDLSSVATTNLIPPWQQSMDVQAYVKDWISKIDPRPNYNNSKDINILVEQFPHDVSFYLYK